MRRILFIAPMALIATAFAGFIAGQAPAYVAGGYGPDALSISVSADKSTVILGEDLLITYTVEVEQSGQKFDSVDVKIKNSSGTVVAQWLGQSGTEGSHNVTWQGAKWNTGAHSGAYAHPKHGDYDIIAIGHKSGQQKTDDTSVDTELVIEADFEDPKPSSNEISSGLDKDYTDTGLFDSTYIVAGLKPSSGDIIWDSGSPDFSDRTLEDMDNDADSGVEDGKEIKSIHFKKSWSDPSDIADGQHTIVFKNVFDQAGNEGLDGYTDGIVTDWMITLW